MQIVDYRTATLNHLSAETTQTYCLIKITQRWEGKIRRELRRFAQFLWPDAYFLGLIPLHSYRLRKQLEAGKVVWWVEHDIPPFDRYRCETYRVELSLAGPDQPQLVVRSGIFAYPVVPLGMEGLKMALVRAGADTPLVIPRQFGPALDL